MSSSGNNSALPPERSMYCINRAACSRGRVTTIFSPASGCSAIQGSKNFTRALRQHTGGGIRMMQRLQQGDYVGAVGAAFDAERALPDGRQAVFAGNDVADA